jgi:hypothetical protein
MSLILIGYWRQEREYSNFPHPNDLIDIEFWKNNSKYEKYVVSYLIHGKPCNFFRGFSQCRICEKILGTFERTDGCYIWPDQLEHYVAEHKVMLPKQFIYHIMNENPWPTFEKEDSFWIKWSKEYQNKSGGL